jgi:arylamine N-acetyltransferase
MCSAELIRDDGSFVEGSVHMVILVELEDTWIVDVGFGGTILAPTPLSQLTTKQYRINPEGCDIAFFEPRNIYHSSEDSPVGKVPYCWLPTQEGYRLLRANRFTEKNASGMLEIEIRNARECELLLRDKFGIYIS